MVKTTAVIDKLINDPAIDNIASLHCSNIRNLKHWPLTHYMFTRAYCFYFRMTLICNPQDLTIDTSFSYSVSIYLQATSLDELAYWVQNFLKH